MLISVTIPAPVKIEFPTDKITDVSFVVQWDAVINQSVDRYIVNWSDGTNPVESVVIHNTSYTVTGLTPNTTYTVTVAAVNMCGTGLASTGNNSVTTNVLFSVNTTSTTSVFHDVTPTVTINTITTNSITYPTSTMNTTFPAPTST